jgi:type IV secretion system protein VirB4
MVIAASPSLLIDPDLERAADVRRPESLNQTPLNRLTRFGEHYDDQIITTKHPSFCKLWEVNGLSFETAAINSIVKAGEDFSNTLGDISKSGRTVYSWLVHDKASHHHDDAVYKTAFAKNFARSYYTRLNSRKLFTNRWFYGLEDKFELPKGAGFLSGVVDKTYVSSAREVAAQKFLTDGCGMFESHLLRYGCEALSLYGNSQAQLYSEPYELINFFLSGSWSRFAVGLGAANDSIGRGLVKSSGALHEFSRDGKPQFVMMLGIKSYASVGGTFPGILNACLEFPFEFVLGQSFSYVSDEASIKQLRLLRDRTKNIDAEARRLVDQYDEAIDMVMAKQMSFGEHSLVLQVKADTYDELIDYVQIARNAFSVQGFSLEEETLTSMGALLSLCPGNLKYRPRPAMVSTRNFAAMCSPHNIPLGKKSGNSWGRALFAAPTASKTLHYVNLHVNDRGHFNIEGKTGQGKSVLLSLLLVFTEPIDAHWLLVDRDKGLYSVTLALGGEYHVISPDSESLFNPFDRDNSKDSLESLRQIMRFCATAKSPISLSQQETLDAAVERVMLEPIEIRGIESLLNQLNDQYDDNGLYRRISQWVGAGSWGWVFKPNGRGARIGNKRIFSIDPTAIYPNVIAFQALMMEVWCRFKEARSFVKSPLGFLADESWKPLSLPFFEDEVEALERTGRKLDCVVGTAVQDTIDYDASKVTRTIVSQSTTEFYLPHDAYKIEELMRVKHTSVEAAQLIQSLPLDSRTAFLRQGDTGVVLDLNIGGMRELRVLSNNKESIRVLTELLKELPPDDPQFLDVFYKRLEL